MKTRIILPGMLIILSLITFCSKDNDNKKAEPRNHILADTLDNAEKYYNMHPGLEEAFTFLRATNLDSLPTGRNEIDGDRLFCLVTKDNGRTRNEAKLETHKNYIDIHYTINGVDEIGWGPASLCDSVYEAYDEARDIAFFNNSPSSWNKISAGSFALFFPKDAHAPMVGQKEIHKIVVKIKLEP